MKRYSLVWGFFLPLFVVSLLLGILCKYVFHYTMGDFWWNTSFLTLGASIFGGFGYILGKIDTVEGGE